MAITIAEYCLITDLSRLGVLKRGGRLLEIGESNWYFDIPVETLKEEIGNTFLKENPEKALAKIKRLNEIEALIEQAKSEGKELLNETFEICRIFYDSILEPKEHLAIDFHSPNGLQYDMNHDVSSKFTEQFDIVVDSGTAEHVFNVYQFFKNVHDITAPNGIMIHGLPFTGWVDHGFYNFQPTFYMDLAMANGYKILQLTAFEYNPFNFMHFQKREDVLSFVKNFGAGRNFLLYIVYQKSGSNSEFKIPMQSYYFGNLSEELRTAWKDAR